MIQEWQVDKFDLLNIRGRQCELCGAINAPLELDHAVFPRAKHRKKHEISELNEPYNLIILCQYCNQRKPKKHWQPYTTYAEWAWFRNCKRYSRAKMVDWLYRIPLVIKENYEDRDPPQ